MLTLLLSFVMCFVVENYVAAPFSATNERNIASEPTVNGTETTGSVVIPKTTVLPFDEGGRVILVVEKHSLIVAGGLVLITCLVLLIGTIIASCCGARSDYDYTMLSQSDFFKNINPSDIILSTDFRDLKMKQKYTPMKDNSFNSEKNMSSVADDEAIGNFDNHVTNLSNG